MHKNYSFLNKINRAVKLRLIKLMRIKDNRQRIANGFAYGTFLAVFPSSPFNTMLCFLAPLLGGNIVAALLGSWIIGPFIITPFWYYVSYLTGKFLFNVLNINVDYLTYQQIENFLLNLSWRKVITIFFSKQGLISFWHKISGVFWALEFGGLILGIVLAALAYKSIFYIEEWFIKYRQYLRQRRIEKRNNNLN